MTYIEFFEKDAIENICSSLAHKPDRVILLGSNKKKMDLCARRYQAVLSDRGMDVEFLSRQINRNDFSSIVASLSEIIETYDDCVFDLTGGDDLLLVAIGIVVERFKDRKIQMHRFNVHNNSVIDGDQDGRTIVEKEMPALSIEENIRLYGGEVVYEDKKDKATYMWDMTPEFKNDIRTMWEICRTNPGTWNVLISMFGAMKDFCGLPRGALTMTAQIPYLEEYLEKKDKKFIKCRGFLNELKRRGLLKAYRLDEDEISITYKDEQVKKCLTVAGKVLEMIVYLKALEAVDKDGAPIYNDAMNGVFIDWDGEIHTDEKSCDTENEIDVMMMRGMVPVFVSCKNGEIDVDELFKLNSVATQFGGKYAKKVLVATSLKTLKNETYLRHRCTDMGIRVIDDLQNMDESKMNKTIRSLWSN